MSDATAQEERRGKQVRDWLLAILRFAVTLEQTDRADVMAMAAAMDRSGSLLHETGFSFFARMSAEFCNAIAEKDHPRKAETLRRHLGRIDHPPLLRALEAAIEFERATPTSPKAGKRNRGGLWKGLQQK